MSFLYKAFKEKPEKSDAEKIEAFKKSMLKTFDYDKHQSTYVSLGEHKFDPTSRAYDNNLTDPTKKNPIDHDTFLAFKYYTATKLREAIEKECSTNNDYK